MNAPTWTMRCAAMLRAELLDERTIAVPVDVARDADHDEAFAADLDGGLGEMAIVAIAARPPGPARVVEAERWARRAEARGIEDVVVIYRPGAVTDDMINAHVELELALRRVARAA